MYELPDPMQEDNIVGQVLFFDKFLVHGIADLWCFDGQVVVIEVALGYRGKLALEVAGEWNTKCRGPKGLVKINQRPIGCLRDVCD